MYLIVIGKILDVLFRIMNCVNVGNQRVHFYFGHEYCYQISYWISLISLLVIVISFSLIFIKLRSTSVSQRILRHHPLNRFIYLFKPEYYYWEYILFIRRILIALFSVSVQDITMKFFFIGILLFFLYLQISTNPFIVEEGNKMEFILLMCLIFIQGTKISSAFDFTSINIVISFLIILPIPLFVYYVYFGFRRRNKIEKDKKIEKQKSERRLTDMIINGGLVKDIELVNNKSPHQTGIAFVDEEWEE